MAKEPSSIIIPPLTKEMYKNGLRTQVTPFDVVRAHYRASDDRLSLTLRKGTIVRIPRLQIREIANADPADLSKVEVQPGGEGISIRKLDLDFDVHGLLANEFAPLFAKALGRRTRGVTTPRKAAASRANGRKGGRPKKRAHT